jgi:hypothetical protein
MELAKGKGGVKKQGTEHQLCPGYPKVVCHCDEVMQDGLKTAIRPAR